MFRDIMVLLILFFQMLFWIAFNLLWLISTVLMALSVSFEILSTYIFIFFTEYFINETTIKAQYWSQIFTRDYTYFLSKKK